MGLNLRKFRDDIFSGVRDVFDANTQADQQRRLNSGQARFYQDQQRPSSQQRINNFLTQSATNVGKYIDKGPFGMGLRGSSTFLEHGSNYIPRAPQSNWLGRGINEYIVDPVKTTDRNVGKLLRGDNPYTGSARQQAGQAAQDVINVAGVIPVGKAAGLVKRGLPAIKTGVTQGAKIGAGFGAAQGASTSLQNELGVTDSLKTIGASTGIGAVGGGVLGGTAPVLGATGRATTKAAWKPIQKTLRRNVDDLNVDLEKRVATSSQQLDSQKLDVKKDIVEPELLKLREEYQKAYDVETNPKRRGQINKGLADLNTQIRANIGKRPNLLKDQTGSIQLPGRGGRNLSDSSPNDIPELPKNISPKTRNLIETIRGKEAPPITKGTPTTEYSLAKGAQAKASTAPEAEFQQAMMNSKPSVTRKGNVGGYQYSRPRVTSKSSQQIVQELEGAAQVNKQRYAKPTVKQRVAELINPYNAGVKVDRAFAKSKGVPLRDVPRTESLEGLAEQSRLSRQAAETFLRDSDTARVLQKYGNDPDFNTYRLFMRDIEQQANGRPALNRGYSIEEMQRFVNDYEIRNPEAREDLLGVVRDIETIQDLAAKAGTVSPEEVALARTTKGGGKYEFYTPATRALPEEMQRATMNANSIGSIGSQRILQDLQGSDIPIDPSFDAITDYINTAHRDIGRTKVASKYAERVQQGLAPGEFKQTAENETQRKTLKQQMEDVSKTVDSLKSSLSRTVTLKSKQKGEVLKSSKSVQASQTKVINEIQTLLSKAKGDSDSVYNDLVERDPRYAQEATNIKSQAFPNLTKQEVKDQISQDLKDLDKKYPKPNKMAKDEMVDFAKSLGSSNERLEKLVGKLDESAFKSTKAKEQLSLLRQQIKDTRDSVQGLSNAQRINRGDYAELAPDPTTGLQVVSGRKDGQTFKIEVPPEMARFLQGLDQEKTNGVLNAIGALSQPIRAGLTGVLNPPFAILNAGFNAIMAPTLSPQGFRTLAPKAIIEGFKGINANNQFQKALYGAGAQRFSGTLQTVGKNASSAEALAAQKNFGTKLAYNLKDPRRLWRELDVVSAKLENMQRTGVAKAAHDARLRKGGTSEEAIADAAYAYNNVLPNFGKQSSLVRQGDKLAMYLGASVAGTRSLLTGIKRDPIGVGARLSAVGAVMTGATAATMAADNGQEFYKDMIDSKKEYLLDNNTIIVLPNASKDPKTGEWSGIIKIPLAPELRSMNSAVWQSVYNGANEKGLPIGQYAQSLFDFTTGQARTLNNPVANLGYGVATNTDPRTGQDIVPSELQSEAKKDQTFKSTSDIAKNLGGALNISPLKVDYVLRGLGLPGQVAQGASSDTGALGAIKENVANRFTGARGKSETTEFFDEMKNISGGIKDKRSRGFFDALHKKNDSDSLLNSANKAGTYLAQPDVFDADKKLDDFTRKQGKPGNPLYDLEPEQVQKVLTYRSGKIYNSAGQNRDKGGNTAFTALGLDEKWYEEFKNAESDFYKKLALTGDDNEAKTFSGAAKPKPSTKLEAKLKYYYTLGKGTGQRSSFLKANPDVLDYWAKSNDFTNDERVALGFKPLTDEESSGYSKYASRGGSGGSGQRSAGSIYKYAIDPETGGSPRKPSVSVKAPAKRAVKAKKYSQPKVSIKKSLV